MEGHGVPYLLKVLSPDGTAVRRFHLAPGEHVVGSLTGVEIQLDEPGVSRRHASIHVLADGGAVVRDLDSKNGTFVAGRRIRETAISGFTMIAFGSAQAVLQPADPARTQVLLGSGEIPIATPEKEIGNGLTTDGLHPLERLAETLEEVLPSLAQGLSTPQEAADELVHRWIAVLPVGRAEVLRAGPGGEAVVAAASTQDHLPRNVATLEVEGPDGWKLQLRAADVAKMGP